MTIFTKEVAKSVSKYYSEKVIGKPITPPRNSNPFPITSLEITKVEEGYVVKCLCNFSGKIAFSNLEKVIPQLDVLPLEEFLLNLNK
jgi:hypothetical protein